MSCGLDVGLGHFVHRYPAGTRRCFCGIDDPERQALPFRVGRNQPPPRQRRRRMRPTALEEGTVASAAIDLLVELTPHLHRLPAAAQAAATALKVSVGAVEDEDYEARQVPARQRARTAGGRS